MQERPVVRPWELAILAAIGTALTGLCLGYLQQGMAPVPEHSGRSIQDGVILWMRLAAGQGPPPSDYPPLSLLVSSVFYQFFGVTRLSALSSQVVFLAPYLAGTWWMGREVGGRCGGLLALLAAAGNPWLLINLSGYFLEPATAAMVATATALLLASRGGRLPGPTVALGLALGLGMLSKWSFLFFVGPAMLWPLGLALAGRRGSLLLGLACLACLALTAWLSQPGPDHASNQFPAASFVRALGLWAWLAIAAAWVRRREGWSPGVGLAIALSLGFAVCGWWYFLSAEILHYKVDSDLAQAFPADQALRVLAQALATSMWAAPVWLTLGVLAGAVVRKTRVPTLILVSGLVAPVAAYSISGVPPHPRYILPAMGLLAVLAFAWWGRIRRAPAILAPLLLAVGVLQTGWGARTWARPFEAWTLSLSHHGQWTWRVPRFVPDPASPVPLGSVAERVLAELERTDEHVIHAVVEPGVAADVDALILEALQRRHLLFLETFHPQGPDPFPKSSLVLVVSRIPPDAPWLSGYRLLEAWGAETEPEWLLYSHPDRRDFTLNRALTRPLPWPRALFATP